MHIQPNFQTKFYNFVKLTRKGVIISIKNSALSAFMTLMVVPKMNMTHFLDGRPFDVCTRSATQFLHE